MRENRTYGLMRGRAYPARDAPPYSTSRSGGVEAMAMPQRGNTIEAIKRLEPPSRVRFLLRAARYGGQVGVSCALLEYAVMHGDEAERIREERTGGCVGFAEGRRSRGARPTGARMSVV